MHTPSNKVLPKFLIKTLKNTQNKYEKHLTEVHISLDKRAFEYYLGQSGDLQYLYTVSQKSGHIHSSHSKILSVKLTLRVCELYKL